VKHESYCFGQILQIWSKLIRLSEFYVNLELLNKIELNFDLASMVCQIRVNWDNFAIFEPKPQSDTSISISCGIRTLNVMQRTSDRGTKLEWKNGGRQRMQDRVAVMSSHTDSNCLLYWHQERIKVCACRGGGGSWVSVSTISRDIFPRNKCDGLYLNVN
jgi:hypothetical protein